MHHKRKDLLFIAQALGAQSSSALCFRSVMATLPAEVFAVAVLVTVLSGSARLSILYLLLFIK